MIIIYHTHGKVVSIDNVNPDLMFKVNNLPVSNSIVALAKEYSNDILVWCDDGLKKYLNIPEIQNLLHHNKMMLSYNPNGTIFFDKEIGYVETTPFIKVVKNVTYPTWQMSSMVGVVHASVLIALKEEKIGENNFDYFLSSIAKLGMPLGLLCYSEPRLLKSELVKVNSPKANINNLFRFVKEHFRSRWVFLLLLNLIIYEKQFPIVAFIMSLRFKQKRWKDFVFENIENQSFKKVIQERTIDVIIPTIGRKKYLYDVLKDFSAQTLLPNRVIIVEQNPIEGSESELDYILSEPWPFNIQHFFIHQSGVCNARNLALDQTSSEWVFLADDDNRFNPTLLLDVFDMIEKFGNEVVTVSYLQQGENKIHEKVIQWGTFGAGNSFVRRNLLEKVRFNKGLEFGYGEDADFGAQLRNQGTDIVYLPEPSILHLKAPVGGFRTKPVFAWQNDEIQPKPSPTIMLSLVLHQTNEQVLGYKTTLYFKYYKHQKIKNPIAYFLNFRKQWDKSVYLANKLKKQNEI